MRNEIYKIRVIIIIILNGCGYIRRGFGVGLPVPEKSFEKLQLGPMDIAAQWPRQWHHNTKGHLSTYLYYRKAREE